MKRQDLSQLGRITRLRLNMHALVDLYGFDPHLKTPLVRLPGSLEHISFVIEAYCSSYGWFIRLKELARSSNSVLPMLKTVEVCVSASQEKKIVDERLHPLFARHGVCLQFKH
jgi:hypothetical protein